jgi:hypothetical protein
MNWPAQDRAQPYIPTGAPLVEDHDFIDTMDRSLQERVSAELAILEPTSPADQRAHLQGKDERSDPA